MASSSKHVRICGHLVEISSTKSNMTTIIFNTRTYYEHIASFLSYKDNIPLKQLSQSQNKMYNNKKFIKKFQKISKNFKKCNTKIFPNLQFFNFFLQRLMVYDFGPKIRNLSCNFDVKKMYMDFNYFIEKSYTCIQHHGEPSIGIEFGLDAD